MKKIPTLFERVYENHKVVDIKNKITEGMEWVLEGKGTATIKWDGSCCAIINDELYKRYDAKNGKKPPEGAIPCCEPDPVTGHHPHWLKCDMNNPADKWFFSAYSNVVSPTENLEDGTYEAVGKHFNGNPYGLDKDLLIPHGKDELYVERTFEGIREYLEMHDIEGIVFWLNDAPMCKIKRTDFGFSWPTEHMKEYIDR